MVHLHIPGLWAGSEYVCVCVYITFFIVIQFRSTQFTHLKYRFAELCYVTTVSFRTGLSPQKETCTQQQSLSEPVLDRKDACRAGRLCHEQMSQEAWSTPARM